MSVIRLDSGTEVLPVSIFTTDLFFDGNLLKALFDQMFLLRFGGVDRHATIPF